MEINASLEEQLKARTRELQQKSRELEIEAALEKVRVRALTMRSSSELSETSSVLFHQLKELEINIIRTGVRIFDDANDAMELWLTTFSDSQEVIRILDYVNLYIHPVFENIIPARQQKKPYAITVLTGPEVRQYYQTMSTYLSVPRQQVYNEEEYFYSFFFFEGALNVVANKPLTEEECNIMIRFAHVFGLIYTRFLDIQKAEEQTREALRQTSLDRVRAEIASMRTANDLQRITPLVWRELTALGVPFFRCGVYIVDDQEKKVHLYFSTPEGHPLAALHLSFDISDTIKKATDHWREQKAYTTQWNRQQFAEWIQTLIDLGQINASEEYLGGVVCFLHPLHFNLFRFLRACCTWGVPSRLMMNRLSWCRSLQGRFQ